MATFKGIVKLTEEQYNTLKTNGTITVGETTVNYDENTLYVTELSGGDSGSGSPLYRHILTVSYTNDNVTYIFGVTLYNSNQSQMTATDFTNTLNELGESGLIPANGISNASGVISPNNIPFLLTKEILYVLSEDSGSSGGVSLSSLGISSLTPTIISDIVTNVGQTSSGGVNLDNSSFQTNYQFLPLNEDAGIQGGIADAWVTNENATNNAIGICINGLNKTDPYITSILAIESGIQQYVADTDNNLATIQAYLAGGGTVVRLQANDNDVRLTNNGFTFNNKNILTEDTGIAKQQGIENSGKILKVDSTGNLTLSDENAGTKKYLHRITLNLSDQASGSPPNKTAKIHLDYYSEQETAYTNPSFATIAVANAIGCSGYYLDTSVSLTETNPVYEIAIPQSNEFILNSSVSITIQSTGSSITDEVLGYVFS